jgi:integrase
MTLIPGAAKGMRFHAEPLTLDECQRLMLAASMTGRPAWASHRMCAAIVLMWRGGLRASEALSIERRDLDFDAGTVRIRGGKGDKDAVIALDPDAVTVLREWDRVRTERGGHPEDQWLGLPYRLPWTYHAMNKALKRLAAKAGITKRMSPHQLRHTMAAHMADEGMDLRIIKDQLRHSNIQTTHTYIDHLNPKALTEAVSRRPGFLTTTTTEDQHHG